MSYPSAVAIRKEAPFVQKNHIKLDSTKSHTQHIKVVADKVGLHRDPPNKLTKKEKAISQAYENLIAGLNHDQFAAMEATCSHHDRSAVEVLAALSLIAPKNFKHFIENGVLNVLPKGVKNPVSSVALVLTKIFAKFSGVKIAKPTAEHYAKRPSTEVIRATIQKDFEDAPRSEAA